MVTPSPNFPSTSTNHAATMVLKGSIRHNSTLPLTHLDDVVGAVASGLIVRKLVCKNISSGQRIETLFDSSTDSPLSFDCEALGLVVQE